MMKKSPEPYEEVFKKALEGFRALSLKERLERLQRIGILDRDGKLAEHYRREPEAQSA